MTFAALKAEIMLRVRNLETCPQWEALATATTYTQLLAAASDIIEWAYGMAGDTLLAEFDTAILAAAGIYTGNVTITNPPLPHVYFLGPGTSTLNLSGTAAFAVTVMGSHNITINLTGNASCELKTWGTGSVYVDIGAAASLCSELSQSSNQSIVNSNVAEVRLTDLSVVAYTPMSGSSANVRVYNFATFSYTPESGAAVSIRQFGANTTVNELDV